MKMLTAPPLAEDDLSATPTANTPHRISSLPAISAPDPDGGSAARREEFRRLLRQLPTDRLRDFVDTVRAMTQDAARDATSASTPEMTA